MLIGLCGKAGSGKDTIADYLVAKYGFKKISLADPIKRLVKDVFVLDDLTVYDRVEREKPLKNWSNWTVRKLLQFIGTELFREQIDDEVWVKSLWYKIQNDKSSNYVTADIRFPNEYNFFVEQSKNGNKFFCIKVIRDGCDGKVGLLNHASEAYDLKGNIEIQNNGTKEELYKKVDEYIKTIL